MIVIGPLACLPKVNAIDMIDRVRMKGTVSAVSIATQIHVSTFVESNESQHVRIFSHALDDCSVVNILLKWEIMLNNVNVGCCNQVVSLFDVSGNVQMSATSNNMMVCFVEC